MRTPAIQRGPPYVDDLRAGNGTIHGRTGALNLRNLIGKGLWLAVSEVTPR